jgi:predicted metal-dependent phosphoesterase TrpH
VQKFLTFIFSILWLLPFLVFNPICSAQQTTSPSPKKLRWYKGNTHTHTINSDGDSTPDEVVRWYRQNGYNFLVLTDHNFLTKVEGLNEIFGAEEQFIVIRGEEISDKFGDKSIHINGLNVERLVIPQGGKNVLEIIQNDVNEIRDANGVPHINHPNYGWAITADELKQVENNKLFEIYNGHPLVNNLGGGDKPGLEQMWDTILSSGKLLYGIAVDDAHHFKPTMDKLASIPGRGWIYVRAEQLSPRAILQALENGDFYASTGVELKEYQVTGKSMSITINEVKTSKYRIQFIGKDGDVLSEVITNPAVYQFRGNEMYVRVRIIESNGKMAWTQPVMFGKH